MSVRLSATCSSCIFFKSGIDIGSCHRYPPVLVHNKVSHDYSLEDGHKLWETDHDPVFMFPQVRPSDVCGEYKDLPIVDEEQLS